MVKVYLSFLRMSVERRTIWKSKLNNKSTNNETYRLTHRPNLVSLVKYLEFIY